MKQKSRPTSDSADKADGGRPYNRNSAKWPLETDEILSDALEAMREKGLTKNAALHALSRDKGFLRKIPAVGGAHSVVDTPQKIYARLAKRAQQPTVLAPSIAKALSLDQWNPDVAALRQEIEDAEKSTTR